LQQLSEISYNDVRAVWEKEVEKDDLQDLQDTKLGRMVAYLSQVRLGLAHLDANERLKSDLMQKEAKNLEFMLKDLLMLRRDKIVKASLALRRPSGVMTLPEEDFYNRLARGLEKHTEFVQETLSGTPVATVKRPVSSSDRDSEPETMDYVMVRFLQSIEEPFLGLDEITYGPFKKEDVAVIPAINARTWIRDGTVERVVVEKTGDLR
jgi:DNA replication initiation complex subunit (GINS family)